ncbi:MAG: creatininase family protein [Planctomycetaceae bacterium]
MTDPTDNRILLHKHTRREFRERMLAGELKLCLIPVAATEQHLEHLAMEHDWASVMHVAAAVAGRLQPHALVAPAMNVGISEHHMRHIGTLSALPGSWLSVLFDAIRSMHHAGFRNILVLNGHGGNIKPCEGIWGQFLQRLEINLVFRSYWDFIAQEAIDEHLSTKVCPGHAQEFETAFAMAAFPDNVRRDAMQDQDDKAPLAATAEAGRALIEHVVTNVTAFAKRMIDGEYVEAIPPFQA